MLLCSLTFATPVLAQNDTNNRITSQLTGTTMLTQGNWGF